MNYPKVGIGVLIFDNQKILLGERQRSHGAATWGPPGGHLEFGENFAECAIRETREETGLIIADPRFLAITNDIFEEDNKHYVSIFLQTTFPFGQLLTNVEKDKVVAWEWFDINLMPDNLFLPLKNLLGEKGEKFLLQRS